MRPLLAAVGVLILVVGCTAGGESPSAPTRLAPVAPALTILSGDAQTAEVGSALPRPVSVRLSDPANGNRPLPGQLLLWIITRGGGRVAHDTTRTDEQGRSEQQWTLGITATTDSLDVWLIEPNKPATVTVSAGAVATHGAELPGQRLCDPIALDLTAGVPVRIVDSVRAYARDRFGNIWPAPSSIVVEGVEFSGSVRAGHQPPFAFTSQTVTLSPSTSYAASGSGPHWQGGWVLTLGVGGREPISCSVGAYAR